MSIYVRSGEYKVWIRGALIAVSALLADAAQATTTTFEKFQLTDKFWSEGAAVADFDRDGHMDIAAGPFWYRGPDFKRRHEIFPATQTFTLAKDDGTQAQIEGYEGALGRKNAYAQVFLQFASDFNADGWQDVLTIEIPTNPEEDAVARWYENPGKKKGATAGQHWKLHIAFDEMGNEAPALVDLFGDGQPVILCSSGDVLGYVKPDRVRPQDRWTFHAISAPLPMLVELREIYREFLQGNAFPYAHGLGYGDINADGRLDVLEPEGWWEQPTQAQARTPWVFHKWSFLKSRSTFTRTSKATEPLTSEELLEITRIYSWPHLLEGAQMHVYDVNGDGLRDIVSSLNAHGYGLAWFEQLPKRSVAGEIEFTPRVFMGATPAENKYGVKFSQLHAVQLVDVDGDSLLDIVTGKRYWAHGPEGPDPESNNAPAVLYWFRLVRGRDGSVDFVPHLIDDNSGVGTQFEVTDVNGDGLKDVVVASKKGAFAFFQKRSGGFSTPPAQ